MEAADVTQLPKSRQLAVLVVLVVVAWWWYPTQAVPTHPFKAGLLWWTGMGNLAAWQFAVLSQEMHGRY